MSIDNIPGTFGSNDNRENVNKTVRRNNQTNSIRNRGNAVNLSPERITDIVCLSLIGLFLLTVVCLWQDFSTALFETFLFPIINIGSKIVAAIAAIGTGIGLLFARFGRRRYWR